MLWNWTVIDSCFLSSSWHVTSKAMFAVSCIGVALLGMTLELLRRVSKTYDESLQRQFQRHALSAGTGPISACPPSIPAEVVTYRASPLQQLIRAVLHVAQIGVAYITMLIAMYYNGYIIISIFIGAFLGKLLFDWGDYRVVLGPDIGNDSVKSHSREEATKCCG